MPCFHPVRLHRHLEADKQLTVGCGRCVGCKLEYSRQWAMRCMHEASLYDENCMITLTYDDMHLPALGTLDRAAFPLFMKRLRKSLEPKKVRYFHAGEYGERFGRPHYHALLFGYDFPDKVVSGSRAKFTVWSSERLSSLWPFGRSEIGSVTFESAAYVARYVIKDVGEADLAPHARIDLETGEVISLEPEYCTMSRRPGIGREWFNQFGEETYVHDSVIVRGRECKPPRFYDSAFELIEPEAFARVRESRRKARHFLDGAGLRSAEKGAIARLSLKERNLE